MLLPSAIFVSSIHFIVIKHCPGSEKNLPRGGQWPKTTKWGIFLHSHTTNMTLEPELDQTQNRERVDLLCNDPLELPEPAATKNG